MPLIHTQTFHVRHYECDAYSYLAQDNYLRYMQAAAFGASAAAGYDAARYEELGHHWLVRETEIEHHAPLHYGDAVQIRTWVADFRRIRSRRAYEFRRPDGGELVARAFTDWVYLDTTAGRPVTIPDEMHQAFFPDGDRPPTQPRPRFPDAPPPPVGAHRVRRPVQWQDIDPAHHVNNARYLSHIEDCAVEAVMAYGWTPARMDQMGYALAPRAHRIEYKMPGLLGDELDLTLWLSDMGPSEVVRHCTVIRAGDGALLARARTDWAWVAADTRRPAPLPAAFWTDLAPLVAGGVR